MLYLVAILLPPLAVLIAGKPIQALLNVGLTLLLWIPGMTHAILVVSNYYADKRTGRVVSAIRTAAPVSASAGGFGAVPVFAKPDLFAHPIANLATGSGFEKLETRGVFTHVSMPNGATGWVRTADIQT